DELWHAADRRVHQHDHGLGPGHEPVPGRLELRPALPALERALGLRLVRGQGPVRRLRLHLAPGHPAALPLRPADALRLEGPRPRRHPQHPDNRGRRGLPQVMDPGVVDTALFWFFGGIAVAAALVVILQRNPLYSAFGLIVTLCALSAIYGLLGSPFIAVLQVVVYAGAIMVLFLFVIMLLNVKREDHEQGQAAFKGAAAVLVALLALQVGGVLARTGPRPPAPEFDASTHKMAEILFSPYFLYVFEATSILILAALVGAIALARKEP